MRQLQGLECIPILPPIQLKKCRSQLEAKKDSQDMDLAKVENKLINFKSMDRNGSFLDKVLMLGHTQCQLLQDQTTLSSRKVSMQLVRVIEAFYLTHMKKVFKNQISTTILMPK